MIMKVYRDFGHLHIKAGPCEYDAEEYTFRELGRIDAVDDEQVPENAVIHGGELGYHYPSDQGFFDVPQEVIEELRGRGYVPVEGMESGWSSWEGRPEWSDHYCDAADVEQVV